MNSGSPIYESGEFRLDAKEKRRTRLNGEDVTLPPKAFDLLQFLVENPRQLLEKTAILDAVWAEQFDDDESGLLRLQNKITNQIVSSMRAALTPNETDMLARRYTASSQAFDAYLKGRYFWNKRSGDDLKKAIGFFNEAKKKDPNFALAFVGLSDAHQMLSEYSGAERASSIAEARVNVEKALELNGEIGEAYCSLAYIQAFYDWDFQAAEASFKRAFELSPNYPTAHQWYGEFLLATGRSDEAYNSLKRARELDPLSPIILTDIVAYYYVTRNFDAAIAEAENVIQIFPKFGFARSLMAMSYLQKGNEIEFYKAAIAADEIYFPPQITESRRKAYEQGGLSELFKLRYQQSTNPPISLFLNDYQRAISAVEVGDTEAAFAWLEKSVAAKDRWVINLNQDPYWSPLRKDPRFNAILSNINLRPAE